MTPKEQIYKHGKYQVHLLPNGDIQIEYGGSPIVWVDNYYVDPANVPKGEGHKEGLPHVVVNAVEQDEPSVCLSIGPSQVFLNSTDETLIDKR